METPTQLVKRSLLDPTKVDTMEVGEAMVESLDQELIDCIERGKKNLSDPSFAIVQILKKDRFFQNGIKRIFLYSAFLPKPTFDQAVWIYDRRSDKCTFMWSIPDRECAAMLSALISVDKNWKRTADWCKSLYKNPQELIDQRRKETKVFLETEKEYLQSHSEELTRAFDDYIKTFTSNSLN